ncbi:hypothetical protein BU16DRAFT_358538 [Lophium mytilinum]|uniref:Uncharacterized protein n=1 Tax=Lophium mytilinum TaxID=390894 RepID=A0A6A6QVC5_9PEZI|nr:hypothetical protein BU16DRAFT_358538 [Lophium mytilinum]
MPNLATRFPHYLLSNVVYEPVSGYPGSSANSIGNGQATSAHDLERKQRIESIARAYLQGRMPRLSSTSSRAPRATRPLPGNPKTNITYDPVPATRRNASRRASNNVGVEGERAAKQPRIEAVAKGYNQGKMPVIQSASLRGPLEKGWKNPWAKASTGRGSSAATPRPRPVQEFDTIVVSTPHLVPHSSTSTTRNGDLRSLSPSLEQSVADHDRAASETTAVNHRLPKGIVAAASLREETSHLETQDVEGHMLNEPKRSDNIMVMPVGERSSANPTTAPPILATKDHRHPSKIKEESRRKLASKKRENPPNIESPFLFRYQKDVAKERDNGRVHAPEGIHANEPDILPRRKGPRRMNFDSSQVVVNETQPEPRSQRNRPSTLISEPRVTTNSLPSNEEAIENGTDITNMKATTGLPRVASTVETAPILSPPPTLDRSTDSPLPVQRDNTTITPLLELEREPATSGKKRKKKAALEIIEATSQATEGSQTHPRREKLRPARLPPPTVPSNRASKEASNGVGMGCTPSTLSTHDPEGSTRGLGENNDPQIALNDVHQLLDASGVLRAPLNEHVEETEQEPAPEREILQDPEPHSPREKSRSQKFVTAATSNIAPNRRKTGENRVDSATHQATTTVPLAIPTTLNLPDPSAIRSKKKNKQKKGSLVPEASTTHQSKTARISRANAHSDEGDIMELIVVKPRQNKSRVQNTIPAAVTELAPPQIIEATEVDMPFQEPPEVAVTVGAPIGDGTLAAEEIIHVPAAQEEPKGRPRKRKSRSSALETEVVSGASAKKKRKRHVMSPVPEPTTNDNIRADVEIYDGDLPQEDVSGQQAFNEPKTPPRNKRGQLASTHSSDVPRTRSERKQAQTPNNALSPEIQREFRGIVDSIHSAPDVQSENDEDVESTIDFITSGIIPFSVFKTGVVNRHIQAAMEIKQPMSTQQLFEAQSPIAFSTEKKRRVQERFGPPYDDETEYLDTQALFDAAGVRNTPNVDLSAEETPVKSTSRRKSRRALADDEIDFTPKSRRKSGRNLNNEDQEYTPEIAKSRRRSGRGQEAPHASRQSRPSRQIVSAIDRIPLQEKLSSASSNAPSDSLRKSSRLREKDSPYLAHGQHLSQPSQQSEPDVDFSFMDSVLHMSPLSTRA